MEEPLFEAGGDVDQINVGLRLQADDLDPDWVTRLLGRSPTFAARKGERRLSGGAEVVQPTGVWTYDLPESTEWILGDAISALLDQLPQDPTIWRQLRERASLEILCGLHLGAWNRGAEFSDTVVARLAARHLAVQLDVYCNPGGTE